MGTTTLKAHAGEDARHPLVDQASHRLRLASDPTRLQILLALAGEEHEVAVLCEALGQSQPTVSHHLALLRVGGIIVARRVGDHNVYSLTELGGELVGVVRHMLDFPNTPAHDEGVLRLIDDIATVVDDPEAWLEAPNPRFSGRKPADLIGTDEEPELRNLIDAAMQGMFS